MKETAMHSIVVIGDGIIGKTTALHLAEAGQQVCLISSSHRPFGYASTAAGAMLGAFGEITASANNPLDEKELDLRVKSAQLYPEWLIKLQGLANKPDAEIMKNGTYVVATSDGPQDLVNLKAIESALNSYSTRYSHINKDKIPFISPHRSVSIVDAILIPSEGYVDSVKLNEVTDAAIAQHRNISVIEGWVDALNRDDDGFHISLTNAQPIHADRLVVAAGVGTHGLLEPFRQKFLKSTPSIIVGKGISLTAKYIKHNLDGVIRTPNRGFACGVHIVPRGDDELYLGATNRVATRHNVLQGEQLGEIHFLLDTLMREVSTDLKLANITSITNGSRPLASDHYPIIGESDIPNLFIATGTYRNGILMAPLVAEVITDAVLGIESKFENAFKPARDSEFMKVIEANKKGLMAQSIEEYIELMHEPGGYLPYSNAEELNGVMAALTQDLISNSDSEVATFVRDMFEKYPIAEVWPEIFLRIKTKDF